MDRRKFLANSMGGLITPQALALAQNLNGNAIISGQKEIVRKKLKPENEAHVATRSVLQGIRYRAIVPDTLDLIARAKLAINGLAGTLDWEGVPEFYFRVTLVPPAMKHDSFSFAACGPKYWESFPMMRVMTGSELSEEIEKRYTDYMLKCIGEDGLFYSKIGPDRPWDKSSPEDWANIYGQGRMIRAMLARYYYDRNAEWTKRLEKMVNKLINIAIYRDDYAYYPTSPGYGDVFSYPKSGWKITELRREAQQTMADLPDHTMGIPMYLGGTILPLVRYYEAVRNERALELAGKLVRFLLKRDSAWIPDGHAKGVTPEEHGQFQAHFHAHTMTLRGILAYGVVTSDTAVKNFARDGYEFARTLGIARLGWFEEYTGKHSHETCGLGNMVALAIKLSESGVGEYWDDVDGYVRNHLTEAQFIDLEGLKKINKELSPAQEKLLERSVGTFAGWGTPTALGTVLMNCCMGNGAQGLYYVWDSIVKYDDGIAKVNVLLNRASPWLDVDSYLPYEGKVVLHNKQAKRIFVRIPGWVEKTLLKCNVEGKGFTPVLLGNYLLIDPINEKSVITVTFPVREEKQSFILNDYGHKGAVPLATYRYDITFRANTAIRVVPSVLGEERGIQDAKKTYDGGKRSTAPTYPAYQDREQYRREKAPTKTAERYATDIVIPTW